MSRITRTQPSVAHTSSVAAETSQSHDAHGGRPGAAGSPHVGQRPPAGRPTPRRLTAGNLATRRAYARAQAKKSTAARRKGRTGARGISDDDDSGDGVDDFAGSDANAPIEERGDSQGDKGGGQGDRGNSQEHHGPSAQSRKTNPDQGLLGDGAYANRRFLSGVLAVLKAYPTDAAARFLQLTLDRLRAGGGSSSGGLKWVAQQLAAYRPAPPAAHDLHVDEAVALHGTDIDEVKVPGELDRRQRLNVLAPLVLLQSQRRYSEHGHGMAISTVEVQLKATALARQRAAEPSS